MNLWKSAAGYVRLRLISAEPEQSLQDINAQGVTVSRVRQKDTLTVEFRAQRCDLRTINQIVQRRSERIELIGRDGVYWGAKRLIRRPVLVAGLLTVLILSLYLPERVLFVQVEGNVSVPAAQIIDAAADCGIRFGAGTRQVRSEKMKNALLHKIPQLQWAGINTRGCVAIISVREKTVPDTVDYAYPISSLVAVRDGFVTELSVTAGSAACKVGQSVKAGQLLISAYTDCGLHIQATKAKGEVYADTNRSVEMITPDSALVRGEYESTQQSFSIIFGKKHINFNKGCGISGGECDRIKSVHYVTLPGGFRLPVAIIVQTCKHYVLQDQPVAQADAEAMLQSASDSYLKSCMVAGSTENQDVCITRGDGVYLLTGHYECNEMIAVSRTEEILQHDEQND